MKNTKLKTNGGLTTKHKQTQKKQTWKQQQAK